MESEPETWTTVLVSALVAAMVTLVIEYFAKPSLEARKERILQRHRDARARLQALTDVVKWVSIAATASPAGQGAVATLAIERLRASADTLIEVPLDLALRTNRAAVHLTTHFAGYVRGYVLGQAQLPPLQATLEMASPLADYFYAPRWRWLYRRRRLQEALAEQPHVASLLAARRPSP